MDWYMQGGSHARAAWLLIGATLSFMLYWFTVEHVPLRSWLDRRFGAAAWFIGNKLLGTILFGVAVPMLSLILYPSLNLAMMGLRRPSGHWPLAISLTVLLAFASWNKNRKIARSHGDFGRYPEIRLSEWKVRTIVLHVSLWSLYLLAYEFMFRGVLLTVCTETMGFPLAVGINVAIYGLAHVPKGVQEAVGAVVLGYVLCILTQASGSVCFAWLIHCALAIVNGLSAFHYRSDMHLVGRKG
ncbi:MAG: CPBP family intramembrane glutamic endopeptidase [Sphaerochaetaceae bacterium]|nr:CPBP family intramembrane metalloprotease [Sphaerochaetaceae bacterium]MDD3941074.1 CPBP family intramembrane metalloprotease [Sphaerochaetaceae bacterium]MDX9939977.1 CPBP family intramembrane glutamic endopeptidase [Sphaerochaetaceae bacterium]